MPFVLLVTAFIISSIILCYKEAYSFEYSPLNKKHNFLIFLCCFAFIVASAVIFELLKTESYIYPFNRFIKTYGAYEQMFDAFMKHRFYIDIEPSERLLELENPYDTNALKQMGIEFPWDRAYYNGHFYSYFGIAPVILIYFPYYFVSGKVPTPQTVCFIMSVVAIPVITALTVKLQKTFLNKVSLDLLLLSVLTVEAGSLVLMLQSSADMYYIAVESGILFLSLYWLLSVCAYTQKSNVKRGVLFFFSGISLVFLVMSRPNLVIFVLPIIPIYLSVLLNKEIKLSCKLLSVISFAVPVIIGAVFVMYYNFARFGSVLEFGSKYQLTISDIRENTLTPALIIPCIYYYFLKLPTFQKEFPHLVINYDKIVNINRYVYVTSTVGAFAFPSNLAFLVFPAALKKQDKVKTSFYVLTVISVLALAFSDICLAGVNLRYLADIMLVVTLLSSLILCELMQKLNDFGTSRIKIIAFTLIRLSFWLSFAVGIMLIFNNERDYIVKLLNGSY